MDYSLLITQLAPHEGQNPGTDFSYTDRVENLETLMSTYHKGELTIIFVRKGELLLDMNHQRYILHANQILHISPISEARLFGYSNNLEFDCFRINNTACQFVTSRFSRDYFRELERYPVLRLDNEDKMRLNHSLLICKKHILDFSRFSYDVLITLFYVYVMQLYAIIAKNEKIIRLTKTSYENSFDKFREFVELHYMKRLKVSDYALYMGISVEQLNRIVRSNTKLSTKKWLNIYIIEKIKNKLQEGSLTLENIATFFKFTSKTAFIQFYRKQTGESPLVYRKSRII